MARGIRWSHTHESAAIRLRKASMNGAFSRSALMANWPWPVRTGSYTTMTLREWQRAARGLRSGLERRGAASAVAPVWQRLLEPKLAANRLLGAVAAHVGGDVPSHGAAVHIQLAERLCDLAVVLVAVGR